MKTQDEINYAANLEVITLLGRDTTIKERAIIAITVRIAFEKIFK